MFVVTKTAKVGKKKPQHQGFQFLNTLEKAQEYLKAWEKFDGNGIPDFKASGEIEVVEVVPDGESITLDVLTSSLNQFNFRLMFQLLRDK